MTYFDKIQCCTCLYWSSIAAHISTYHFVTYSMVGCDTSLSHTNWIFWFVAFTEEVGMGWSELWINCNWVWKLVHPSETLFRTGNLTCSSVSFNTSSCQHLLVEKQHFSYFLVLKSTKQVILIGVNLAAWGVWCAQWGDSMWTGWRRLWASNPLLSVLRRTNWLRTRTCSCLMDTILFPTGALLFIFN